MNINKVTGPNINLAYSSCCNVDITTPSNLDIDINLSPDHAAMYDMEVDVAINPLAPFSGPDYNNLRNKPSINGVTLESNKTSEEIGVIGAPVDPSEGDLLVYRSNEWVAEAPPEDTPFILLRADLDCNVYYNGELITGSEINNLALSGKAINLLDEENERMLYYEEKDHINENYAAIFFNVDNNHVIMYSIPSDESYYIQTEATSIKQPQIASNNDILKYYNHEWISASLSAFDVNAIKAPTNSSDGDFLVYRNNEWAAESVAIPSKPSDIGADYEVTIVNITENQGAYTADLSLNRIYSLAGVIKRRVVAVLNNNVYYYSGGNGVTVYFTSQLGDTTSIITYDKYDGISVRNVNFGTYSKPNDGIPASDLASDVHLIPSGGSQGQILKKNSGTDYDIAWASDNWIETEYFDFTWDGDHNPVPAAGVTGEAIFDAIQAGKLVFARVTVGSSSYPYIFSLHAYYSNTYLEFVSIDGSIIDALSYSVFFGQGLWDMNEYIIPNPAYNIPANLGVAAVGSSETFARADHVHAMPSATDIGAYVKPNDGIPASDFELAVQSSLNKADTALQSFVETDPTVPNWAKESSKPSYDFSEINVKPSTISGYGITDAYTKSQIDINLSNYVQTSRTINEKALSSDITLDASDVGAIALPTNPSHEDILQYRVNQWKPVSVSKFNALIVTLNSENDLTADKTYFEISEALTSGQDVFVKFDHAGSIYRCFKREWNSGLMSYDNYFICINNYEIKQLKQTRTSWSWDTMVAIPSNASDLGAYTKPSTGIPSSDFDTDVQNKLNNAIYVNGAYQAAANQIMIYASDYENLKTFYTISANELTRPATIYVVGDSNNNVVIREDINNIISKYTDYATLWWLVDENYNFINAITPISFNETTGELILSITENSSIYTAILYPSDDAMVGTISSISVPSAAIDVGAISIAQGSAHAGEFLVVGSDGNVITIALSSWQGGTYGS